MTSYDYVVVGAGSAGAVVAARLTEDPSVRVLLLEAGPAADADEVTIPAAFSSLFKTRWDWNYTTTEQKQLHGRRAYWPRMKALGGCSSMNAMIYIRGNALDYDTWRDGYGATGWGYEDVLPYFVRAEGNTRLAGPYHGSDGPLRVEDRVFTHELSQAWVDSAVASGFARTDDFNGAAQEGAGLYQVTCRKGRRWSVADAYLAPALDRPNLTVLTGALATRVVVEGGRATGVAYALGGGEQVAHADAEVVLAGGAVNSPQLLMLSGIGPASHLREHGIDVVADLPGVGSNLHDHPALPLIWTTRGTTDLAQASNLVNLLRWKATGTGPLASNIGEAGAFFASRDGLPAPDLQVHVAPSGFYDNGLHEPQAQMFTAAPTLVNVASRGTLRLRSADPTWHPEIDAAYYDDQTDLDAMLAGVRRVLETVTSGPLARFLVDLWMPRTRGAVPTDSELVEHIRAQSQTLYHPVGTCAMGSGESAVVDPELRVRGVEGLRVADASVMPMVPRGNTNAPTIMVGEKAADLLRGRTLPPTRVAVAAAGARSGG
ncbi:GMC family oxidoreductase [Mumia sp. DW29H23]|uniref:GMC family oxidoreductase n=1 Tax=Mumia sp. DW29H23 TaxID=3421241 RepID=UPI003D687FF3